MLYLGSSCHERYFITQKYKHVKGEVYLKLFEAGILVNAYLFFEYRKNGMMDKNVLKDNFKESYCNQASNKSRFFKATLEFSIFKLGQIPSSAFIQLQNFSRIGLLLWPIHVELRLSWSWDWGRVKVEAEAVAILGAEVRLRNRFGVYSHSAKLLILSMFHSILTFDFDLILVSIFGFLGH